MRKTIIIAVLFLLLICILTACQQKTVPVVGEIENGRKESDYDTTASDGVTSPGQVSDTETSVTRDESHIHTTNPGIWYSDLTSHWRKCVCGENFDIAVHSFATPVSCSVCHMQTEAYEDNRTLLSIYNDKGHILYEKLYDASSNELYEIRHEYTYSDLGIMLTDKVYKNGVAFYENSYDQNGVFISQTKYDASGNPIAA